MTNETQILAAKLLAQILSGEGNSSPATKDNDLSQVLTRLDEMNSRLVQIESKINLPDSETSPANQARTVFPVLLHPSRERFDVEENDLQNVKTCHFEPGGKPCDHCSMCSSRGF